MLSYAIRAAFLRRAATRSFLLPRASFANRRPVESSVSRKWSPLSVDVRANVSNVLVYRCESRSEARCSIHLSDASELAITGPRLPSRTLMTGMCKSRCQRCAVRTPHLRYAAISFQLLRSTTEFYGGDNWRNQALAPKIAALGPVGAQTENTPENSVWGSFT